jgi:hypothetical protein
VLSVCTVVRHARVELNVSPAIQMLIVIFQIINAFAKVHTSMMVQMNYVRIVTIVVSHVMHKIVV